MLGKSHWTLRLLSTPCCCRDWFGAILWHTSRWRRSWYGYQLHCSQVQGQKEGFLLWAPMVMSWLGADGCCLQDNLQHNQVPRDAVTYPPKSTTSLASLRHICHGHHQLQPTRCLWRTLICPVFLSQDFCFGCQSHEHWYKVCHYSWKQHQIKESCKQACQQQRAA